MGATIDPSRLKRRVTATLATLLLVVSAAGCLTPAPPSVDISVRNAAWVFEHPALGTHSSRGEYFLALNVSVRNTGDGDAIISAADFTVYWKGSTQGQPARLSPWVTMTIKWGMTATVTVGTNASSLLA